MSKQTIRRPAEGARVAIAQIAPVAGDPAANLAKHREAVVQAREQGAGVLVFPELSLTDLGTADALADAALGREHETLVELAALSTEGPAFIASYVEESSSHLYLDAATWFEGGKAVYTHRKMHLRTEPGFEETRILSRGKRLRAFDTGFGRAAMLPGDDALHPLALNVVALDGAETIYVPALTALAPPAPDVARDVEARHLENYLRVMARSLGVFVVYVNRAGTHGDVESAGGSMIIAPDGSVLAQADGSETVVSAVLPANMMRRRRVQSSVLRDEDLDTAISELERIRDKAAPRAREGRPEDSGPRDRDERPRGYRDERPSGLRDERPHGGYRGEQRGGPRDRPWEERPRRSYDRDRRDDRPDRRSGRESFGDRPPPRRFEGGDRPPRRFQADDRPPRRFEGGDRPPRQFDGADRPPRRFEREGDDRPRRHGPGGGRYARPRPSYGRGNDRRDERGPRGGRPFERSHGGRGRPERDTFRGGRDERPFKAQAPGRYRPERGERRSRPAGRPFPPDRKRKDEDE